jgi:multidrug efflux pump subunit AcrA (membrane-fusion protein)
MNINMISFLTKLLLVLTLQVLSLGIAFGKKMPTPEIDFPSKPDKAVYIHGVISAQNTAVISSSLNGRMIKVIPFAEGESFEKGAELVRFDCTRNKAEAKAARVAAYAFKTTFNSNQELDQYGAIGKNDVLISEANFNRAQAEAEALEAVISDCIIKAPYAGRVVERFASVAESPITGSPIMKIHQASNLELKLIVPSHWLSWLTIGTPFEIKLDENGKTHKANIIRLGATVDPVSKTIRVIGNFRGIPSNTIPGMSGSARFIPLGSH